MNGSKIQFVLPMNDVMKKYEYFLTISFLTSCHYTATSPIISFFFKPLIDQEQLTKNLQKPGKIAKHTLHSLTEHIPVTGICATYSGYITSSDYDGQIIFPLKHTKPTIDIIVTTELKPIPLFENTIHHWEIIPHIPTTIYTLSQEYNKSSNTHSWKTEQAQLPENNQIPLAALVIIARPKDIHIPLGIQPTIQSANLNLPPIYVKKGIDIIKNTNYLLYIRHFFRPTIVQGKREPLRLMTHIID